MCGINLRVWKDESCEFCRRLFGDDNSNDNVGVGIGVGVGSIRETNLQRRGPDAQGVVSSVSHPECHEIRCAASVLQMRSELKTQPVAFVPAWAGSGDNKNDDDDDNDNNDEHGDDERAYLCWNGEIYQQLPSPLSPLQQSTDEAFRYNVADTSIVVDHLESPLRSLYETTGDEIEPGCPAGKDAMQRHIAETMGRLYNAEFAFCVLTADGVCYGRDGWGRRSLLLWNCPNHCGSFQLVSVAEELPTSLAVPSPVLPKAGSGTETPAPTSTSTSTPTSTSTSMPTPTPTSTSTSMPTTTTTTTTATKALEWTEVPPGTVHRISFSRSNDPLPGVPYPKPVFSLTPLPEHLPLPPLPETISDATTTDATTPTPTRTISDRLWRASLELEFHLRRAVEMRLDQSSERRSTGVLFSGGVDSVVLAALAAEILSAQHRAEKERLAAARSARSATATATATTRRGDGESEVVAPVPILYLYNVSFGPNPEKSADRKAALKSYQTLREKHHSMKNNGNSNSNSIGCKNQPDNSGDGGNGSRGNDADPVDNDEDCDVKIVFCDIVVEWEDICRTEPHIRVLLSPKHTVMDINIATALWFASRGKAAAHAIATCHEHDGNNSDSNGNGNGNSNGNSDNDNDDRSPRVLLLGMGADELMGGYGRHRKAHERGGWKELQSELTMDQNRLWERNCGRDDRLCSDHGREARFPFLDPHVVRFLQKAMACEDGLVCDFGLPPGVGDKRILRLVAERLGLDHASGLVKRAIQFGSRISHLSDTKRFGSRRKAKGVTKI